MVPAITVVPELCGLYSGFIGQGSLCYRTEHSHLGLILKYSGLFGLGVGGQAR